jgi:spermidine/putrescine transport system substrate-binding protein
MQDIRSTRRSFLKAGAALGGLTIAPRAIVEAQAADPQTLSWLCYPGHAAPEVIGPFEQENNVKILAKEYSGGEKMMALINGSPEPSTSSRVTRPMSVNSSRQTISSN